MREVSRYYNVPGITHNVKTPKIYVSSEGYIRVDVTPEIEWLTLAQIDNVSVKLSRVRMAHDPQIRKRTHRQLLLRSTWSRTYGDRNKQEASLARSKNAGYSFRQI